MEPRDLSPSLPVADLLADFPAAIDLLLKQHLDCPGCPMARFCSLEEVCRLYELSLDQFLVNLQERISTFESD